MITSRAARLILAVLISLLLALPTWAAHTDPADCEEGSLQTAIDAASDGETIIVPAGSCTWSTTVTISGKALTIQGAGIDTTTITLDSSITTGLIDYTTPSTGAPRITGFTFDGGATGSNCSDTDGLLWAAGINTNWRVDHNRFVARRCHGFVFRGSLTGVVDHNDFEQPDGGRFSGYIHHPEWGGGGDTCSGFASDCGDRSWAAATNLGTAECLYLEDNTFERTGATSGSKFSIDGWMGQRYCARFNTLTNTSLQNHGTDSSGRVRGARKFEHYKNTIIFNAFAFPAAIATRGGTGVFWGNEATTSGGGSLTRVADMSHYRLLVNAPAECSYWGCCDDAANNDWDEGAGTSDGYACMDQVGRGQGDLISGDDPSPPAWPNQALEPVYGWDNNLNSSNSPLAAASGGTYITANQDFYTEGASFDGTTGMGSGARSSRPATCTTGVAYWSTDGGTNWNTSNGNGVDGGRDLCTSTDTWTNDSYVPYTYPHPLTVTAVAPSLSGAQLTGVSFP